MRAGTNFEDEEIRESVQAYKKRKKLPVIESYMRCRESHNSPRCTEYLLLVGEVGEVQMVSFTPLNIQARNRQASLAITSTTTAATFGF